MMKRGRSTDQALLRTAVNKKLLTYSHKRLIKDLEEIENQKIPTVGVTARPLDNDLFTWHANIRGPEGTLYEGGVFHIQMVFPQSYPHHPPTVSLFNTLPHPNVFGNYICLDMICQHSKPEQGGGWSSAYSAQSILTQLQSFLFEQNLSENKEKTTMEIKKAVKQANSFKCRKCKHGGKLSCWPLFSTKENSQQFKCLEEENSIIRKELICFHTKLPYTDNQLGLGLKISKIPRTGNIREAQTFYDYISIKAFLKESVNQTSFKQRITHWMPVYFGKNDNEQRFFKFLTKAISMIMTNSTRNFKKDFVLEVLPKLMITCIYHIMDEKKHASIRQIRLLIHIHSILLFCLKRFPELVPKINEQISTFINNEKARIKQNQPNLGCILALLSSTDGHKFSEICEAYFNEQLDRQVLWILKTVPELLDESLEEEADKKRAEIVFKSQKTSFQIFCFYKLFISEICEKRKTRADMYEEYYQNLCKLTNKEEQQFQRKIFNIQKNVNDFGAFFEYTGVKKREEEEITEMLKTAIKNSERKKYHGQFQTIHELPNSQEQFKKILAKIPSYKQFINVQEQQKKEKDKTSYKYIIKEGKSCEDDWKRMCIDRWAWIKEALVYEKQLTAKQISSKALDYTKQGILKAEDRLTKIINTKYLSKQIDHKRPKIDVPQISWKQLFLRLDLEDFLSYIDMNPDFGSFYEKLEVCKHSQINTLLIPMIEISQIKSGYYYLTSILSKLTCLKYIEFSGLPQGNRLQQKAAKAIKKGFHNFLEAKGSLQILSFHNITVDKDYSDALFEYVSNTDDLTSIRFHKTNILAYGNSMKALSNSFINIKNLQQIVLNQAQLNEDKCKILADVLMRTKKLRIFEIHNSSSLNNGLASIIYNLSFSPNLEVLDISRTVSNVAETVVSLYKLLKISASIELLYGRNVTNLNQNLTKQFWISLGENHSLRVLDLAFSGDISGKKTDIGNSIAFNAKKKGILQYFDLTGCLSGALTLQDIYKGMCISEYDDEKIYGDPNKASKMISSNYTKEYFNNLKAFQFNFSSNMNPNFNLSHFNKLITKKDPEYVQLLSKSPKLTSVSFKQTAMSKNFAEILVLALDPRRENFKSQIKILDLSKNNLGKEGIKALAEVLPYNNIIEVLDLSKNRLGVSGARQLAVSLKKNTSLKFLNLFNNNIGYDGAKALAQNILTTHQKLEFLEIGHNRIRNKGLKSITDAITSNKNTALHTIGLRFNFINNIGATYFFNKITSCKTKIAQVYLKNNQIDDVALNNLEQIKQHEKSPIFIDMLEKLKYLDAERNERTVWIHPIQNINLQNLKKFFEITYKSGIVIDARIRRARKYPNKNGENIFAFIEFADTNSVNRALHLASKKLAFVDGQKFRIYKAGTGTFIYAKKTSKQKKLEQAKRTLPPVPYGIQQADLARGAYNIRGRPVRGRGGRGGRGGRR